MTTGLMLANADADAQPICIQRRVGAQIEVRDAVGAGTVEKT